MMHVLQVAWTAFQAVAPFLVVALIPSLINALLPYPSAQGAVGVLHVILDVLSVLVRHDSPGTLKPPFTLSKAPTSTSPPSPPSSSPPAAGGPPLLALFALVLFSIPGCGHLTAANVKATGIDAAKCAAPDIGGAIGAGVIDLLDAVEQNATPDYQQIGLDLAERYGVDAAICVVQVAWQHLGPQPTPTSSPPSSAKVRTTAMAQRLVDPPSQRQARRVAALDWLVHHQSQWARGQDGDRN
jgi:hypothetical protein